MGEADWRTLVTGWFPELSDTGVAAGVLAAVTNRPRDHITAQLKAGVTGCDDPPAAG
jgi:hypothetical protein